MNLLIIVRWIHVLAGAAWLGEVVTINFVLIPVLKSMTPARRVEFIRNVFPRIFRLASILAVTALVSGLSMSYLMTGWKDLRIFTTTRWGLEILVGGLLGLGLTVFHFVVEGRLEPRISALDDPPDQQEVDRIMKFLAIVPRAGLLVILVIILFMMVAARGL